MPSSRFVCCCCFCSIDWKIPSFVYLFIYLGHVEGNKEFALVFTYICAHVHSGWFLWL